MTYTEKLEQQLHQVDRAMDGARKTLAESDISGKVGALASLQKLQGRREDLQARIDQAKKEGAENWSALHESIREEADALKDSVKAWIDSIG